MKPLLIINNYDSFVFNLIQIIEERSAIKYRIFLNDQIPFNQLHQFSGLILSPGPHLPIYSGKMMQLIEMVYTSMPILGVCLGHQAIAQFFGAHLVQYPFPFHGQKSKLKAVDNNSVLFRGLDLNLLVVGRYHSWGVSQQDLPTCLKISSYDGNGEIMSLEHQNYPIYGVQFHPESYLSNCGDLIVQNWLQRLSHNESKSETIAENFSEGL